MKSLLLILAFSILPGLVTVELWAEEGRSLDVVVTYESGEVTVEPPVYVTLFSKPFGPNEDALPFSIKMVSKNGEIASFSNIVESPVYVAAIYDDQARGQEAISKGNISGLASGGLMRITFIPPFFTPVAVEQIEGEKQMVPLTFSDARVNP